ncbi:MAG TPA: DUF58 domain-containing protein [Bacteroidia bacterium]|nr:DUF58 domain-containing protein [Bacteroidia bacterium]
MALAAAIILMVFSHVFKFLFSVAITCCLLIIVLLVADLITLFSSKVRFHAIRQCNKLMSLGDDNHVRLVIASHTTLPLEAKIIDELPYQFQKRDFSVNLNFTGTGRQEINYTLRPLQRGEYVFGNILIYLQSRLRLAERRVCIDAATKVAVYPSIIQMKKYELMSFTRSSLNAGIKRIRRIGHSYEFEQIKNYVRGDDYRSINWRATGRKAELMVNQYEDEKSQNVYTIIDKSRSMKMPFNGLSLLDYSINSSLAMSNIILQKGDKAGLITFSNKIDSMLSADRKRMQLNKIMELLYKQKESVSEASFELLFTTVKARINNRSLLLFYTNFESRYAMERVLSFLRMLNKLHLLVVIFFENTELKNLKETKADTLRDIYFTTIGMKLHDEKTLILQQLKQYGIQTILTSPENLSINTINKYVELKSRGMI